MLESVTKIPNVTDLPVPRVDASVWYGKEMTARDEWLYELTPDDVVEIEDAMRPLAEAKTDIAKMTQADFPLPNLSSKLNRMSADILNGRGFTLLRGLPVERWSIRESATAYFGIGSHLGNARSQNGKGHVLGHVRDLGRDAENDPTARIYQTRERQTYHTDSCDIVALLCLKTAQSGGFSALVSSMTIYKEMHEQRPDLLPYLFESMGTDRRGEIPEGEKPWHEIPVYNWHEGYLSAIYARRYIESARRFSALPALSPIQIEALDLFDSLAEDPNINMQMEFQPGDIQWVHNHTMLHDRTSYVDWPELDRKRHLLRLWLAAPKARPLPQVYAQRYGKVDIGDRGGIIVPGEVLNAPLEPV
jgi:hypothetical protein